MKHYEKEKTFALRVEDEYRVPIENFSGTFYGNGYAINDMRYRGGAMARTALFGVLAGGRITGLHYR